MGIPISATPVLIPIGHDIAASPMTVSDTDWIVDECYQNNPLHYAWAWEIERNNPIAPPPEDSKRAAMAALARIPNRKSMSSHSGVPWVVMDGWFQSAPRSPPKNLPEAPPITKA